MTFGANSVDVGAYCLPKKVMQMVHVLLMYSNPVTTSATTLERGCQIYTVQPKE